LIEVGRHRALLDKGPRSLHSPSLAAKRPFHRLVGLIGASLAMWGLGPAEPRTPTWRVLDISVMVSRARTGQHWEMHRPPWCFNLFLAL
jgi:hypothetical protein